MNGIFTGKHPVFEAASLAFSALFEGKGMVCRIIDGTRDYLVSRGMPREQANDTVLKVRQMFFDPFASPGRHPTTDPEFKKMLPLFFETTALMVNVFHYGTSRYDRERAEDFAARFVPYVKGHFSSGAPEMTRPQFLGMVRNIEGAPAFSPDVDDYGYVRVNSWEELKELSDKYRLDDWCNVKSYDDWDRYSLNGQGRFYLLFTGDAGDTYGKLDVIGITVNHYGKVVYAFDRDNECVDKAAVSRIADAFGITEPFAVDFSTGIDLVKAGHDYRSVFTYAEDIGRGFAVVGFEGKREMCILDYGVGEYASGPFVEISPVRRSDGMYILDGKALFDTEEGSVVLDLESLPGFRLDADCMDIADGGNACALKESGYGTRGAINAVCLADPSPVLMLDRDNRIPISGVEFVASGDSSEPGSKPTVANMGNGDFWVVETDGGTQYVVDRPGKPLDACVQIPATEHGYNIVLSREGYYANVIPGDGPSGKYYLMKGGNRLIDRPFADIGAEDGKDYGIYMVTPEGETYLMDTSTGKIRKA